MNLKRFILFGGTENMALFTWTAKMSVGVMSIDKEHQGLVMLINTLHDKMLEGRAKDVLAPILEKLVDYTHTHFTNEETLFKVHGYPESAQHRTEHDAFRKKTSQLYEDFKSGQGGLSVEITSFLRDWLVKHIMGTDTQYMAFFKAKGVR
jgi:hemerythrin